MSVPEYHRRYVAEMSGDSGRVAVRCEDCGASSEGDTLEEAVAILDTRGACLPAKRFPRAV